MQKLLAALATTVLAVASQSCSSTGSAEARTPEQRAVMATITGFVDAFNAGDAAKATAACTDEMSILDEFPPHEWHGSGAMAKWLADYGTDAQKRGITEGVVTLVSPRHIDVAEEHAYVVISSDYTFKQQGELVQRIGSLFMFALHKEPAGWRVTGWSWANN